MLNIEEILKISDEMGIEVRDGTGGKHYILDNLGKEVEFNTSMVTGVGKEDVLDKSDSGASVKFSVHIASSVYNLSSCDAAYIPKPVPVNDSITGAA